jgi:DNA-directed RNA polymerase subunit M/transcription elongation factor TFIIS
MDCPECGNLMTLYPNAPSDDEDDFFECGSCGYKESIVGQRSADDEPGDD